VNISEVVEHICNEIKAFTDITVIGLSGGADSTLVACLCKQALGRENVYGIGMPFNEFDRETFNDVSESLASKLGVNYYVKPVTNIADSIDKQILIPELCPELTPVNSGNSRSRARMCVLYGVAHSLSTSCNKRVRVMGTGNLSEDFIGYDTKGGDALGDLFPVGELYKSEVYKFLDYFVENGLIESKHVNKTPSAGLEDGQTDEEDLGFTYDEMELGIRFCRGNLKNMPVIIKSISTVGEFVWNRHLCNKHKHEAPPTIGVRKFLDKN